MSKVNLELEETTAITIKSDIESLPTTSTVTESGGLRVHPYVKIARRNTINTQDITIKLGDK